MRNVKYYSRLPSAASTLPMGRAIHLALSFHKPAACPVPHMLVKWLQLL